MIRKSTKTFQDMRKQTLGSLWRKYVFIRKINPKLESLLTETTLRSGIYFIGCGDEVVYIGQTNSFERRTIESLGRIYHQVNDTKLPWSLGLAKCHRDANELESTAIRILAPKFNTSIPSVTKSTGEEPQIQVVVPIFADQVDDIGGAFLLQNLENQANRAKEIPNPPWKQGHATRRSSADVAKENFKNVIEKRGRPKEVVWNDKFKHELMGKNGLSVHDQLKFEINLIENGDVLTIDGEFLGTWSVDQDGFFDFVADGEDETTLTDVFTGSLCRKIREWAANK